MTCADLRWDTSRPIGPIDDGVQCHISTKRISFHDAEKRSRYYGYIHFAQCSRLCADNKQHILCFRVAGLIQEYGLNAVAFVLDPEDRRVELSVSSVSKWDHNWIERSQQFAPYPTSFITFLYNTASNTLTLFAEGDDSFDGKRKREDLPEWHQVSPLDTPYTEVAPDLWSSKVYALVSSVDGAPMRFGVRMDSMLNNTVEIVDPTKTRAWQTLKDKLQDCVVYK